MPLLDHFHAPLTDERHWESFHTLWIATMVRRLNGGLLPSRYFAEANVHFGPRIQADVASLERGSLRTPQAQPNGSGPVVLTVVWTTPTPTCVIPAVFPEEFEVRIRGGGTGGRLAAVIEVVSPSNKDRPETRLAFCDKCAAYLQTGIGVVVVDVVTERLANLHNELMRRLELSETLHIPGPPTPYAVAYRPIKREERDEIDCWQATLTVGETMPILPLALLNGPTLPLDLESTYMEARRDCGL